MTWTLAGFGAALAAEIAAFWLWFHPADSVGALLAAGTAVHCLAPLALHWTLQHGLPLRHRDPKRVMQVLIVFFFPGLGWLFALFLQLQPSLSPEEAKALQWTDEETVLAGGLPSRSRPLVLGKEIQPISEVLAEGNLEMKREAIRRLSGRRDAMAIQMLKKALLDSHAEIRLYAVNALNQMEGRLVDGIQAAEKQTLLEPEEADSWLELGRLQGQYAEGGLLEGMLQEIYRQKSFRTFEKARSLFPEKAEAWAEAVQAALRLDRVVLAEEMLGKAFSRFPDEPRLRLFRARQAFAQQRFDEVRSLLSGLPAAQAAICGLAPEVLELWQTSTLSEASS